MSWRELNIAALEVFRRGHVPIVGVNMALPLIEIAGQEQYDRIMMPLSLAAAERCDAAFRIGGPSHGADEEVERIEHAVASSFTTSTIYQLPQNLQPDTDSRKKTAEDVGLKY